MFDLVVSATLLICLLPVLAVVAVLVRWRLGSPVIFRAIRPGLHGKPFCMYKFRTMTNARDKTGRLLPDKYRITRLGEMLRRSSLDELPQLVNVIKGEMSLVGPRPLAMEYLPLYNMEQARRHHVKPGITGWAQVNGCRGETETIDKMERRVEFDLDYLRHWSIWLDIKIIALTALTLLKQDNAY